MKRTVISLIISLPCVAGLGACDTESTDPPDITAPEDGPGADGGADLADHQDHHGRHPGPAAFGDAGPRHHRHDPVRRLCELVDCTDVQRDQLRELATDLREDARPDRATRRARGEAMADAFRAETLDPALVRQRTGAMAGHHGERAEAFETFVVGVHGVLTPRQRETLAEAIEARGPGALGPSRHVAGKRSGRRGHGGRRGWRQGPADGSGSMLDRVCAQLECTGDQRAALASLAQEMQEARPDPTTHDTASKALAAAIRGETLTVEQVRHDQTAMEQARARTGRTMEEMVVRFHAILTPEQRNEVAARIERGGHLPIPMPMAPPSPHAER